MLHVPPQHNPYVPPQSRVSQLIIVNLAYLAVRRDGLYDQQCAITLMCLSQGLLSDWLLENPVWLCVVIIKCT